MRRINNQMRQRRRLTWLDLPAHDIKEVDHGSGTESALSQDGTQAQGSGRGRDQAALHGRHTPSTR
ncbi:hypothetical protein [Pseudomonas mohnii]